MEKQKLSPLEALNEIKNHLKELHEKMDHDPFIHLYETLPFILVENSLKALEIIKNKKVNVGDFVRCKTIEDYNDYLCYGEKEKLTKEEYDLLKKVSV